MLGVGAAAVGGVLVLREHLRGDELILEVDDAVDLDPPTTIEPDPAVTERVAPLAIRFEDVGVDNDEIRPVGVEDDGLLEVPDETEVGWWKFGSSPGLPGATVLAAHVSWNGTTGPFFRLGDAEIGDRLEVTTGTGATRTYQVVERTMYQKDGLPRDRIWRTEGEETLVLITCGGDFNPDISRYRHNIVVYAIPVDTTPAT